MGTSPDTAMEIETASFIFWGLVIIKVRDVYRRCHWY